MERRILDAIKQHGLSRLRAAAVNTERFRALAYADKRRVREDLLQSPESWDEATAQYALDALPLLV